MTLYDYFFQKYKTETKRKLFDASLQPFCSIVDALLRILYQFLSRSKRCHDTFEIYYVISKSSKQKLILSLNFFFNYDNFTFQFQSKWCFASCLNVTVLMTSLTHLCIACSYIKQINRNINNRIKLPLNLKGTLQKQFIKKNEVLFSHSVASVAN